MTFGEERTAYTASLEESFLARAAIVIPTQNAARYWTRLHKSFQLQGVTRDQVLIVDSSSSDDTAELVKRAGYRLKTIPAESFGHGSTRQFASESLPNAEFLVYLTQDAIPCGKDSLELLLRPFQDPNVGAAYGRQLPRDEAGAIERHARIFNYPATSDIRTFASRHHLGIRAAFVSNSFAAFRRTALEDVGGFPTDTIVSEEVSVVARMLMSGWKVAYEAEATAIHSHPLSLRQEFARYFDIGVHHGRENYLLEQFGSAGGEGRAFVISQFKFLLKEEPSLIPLAILRNVSKFCSYQLGLHERYLPEHVKRTLSGQSNFWQEHPRAARSGPQPLPRLVSANGRTHPEWFDPRPVSSLPHLAGSVEQLPMAERQ